MVKVTLEGQMIKWSYIELAWAINSTFIHGFENNLAQLFISMSLLIQLHTASDLIFLVFLSYFMVQ